ncbi:MAG TPA: hypothetical protein VGF30_12935 [Bacteroidia bacterium]
MRHLFTILALSLITVKGLQAQSLKDTSECLQISGKIENIAGISESDNTYTVELIYYNTVIDSITRKNNRSFNFILNKNSMYTIRISKKGYIPRLVSIDTSLDNDDDNLYRFHFDTELLKDEMKEIFDAEALEFPITIVSFNKSQEVFHFNKEYTMNIKHSLYSTNRR